MARAGWLESIEEARRDGPEVNVAYIHLRSVVPKALRRAMSTPPDYDIHSRLTRETWRTVLVRSVSARCSAARSSIRDTLRMKTGHRHRSTGLLFYYDAFLGPLATWVHDRRGLFSFSRFRVRPSKATPWVTLLAYPTMRGWSVS
jgi:hypothetical protein